MKSLPRLSVENPILVNLIMFAIIVGGVYSAYTLVREMFPEFSPNQVMIATPYPGASPAEVEKGIAIKIEEQIKDIEGVERMLTTLHEGSSSILIELRSDFDELDQAVTDARDAVDSIPRDDFPEEAEETIVRRFEPKLPVISATIFGAVGDKALKELGLRLRDDLLALPEVTDVEVSGTRLDEISVEVRPDRLIKHSLSFMEIAEAIRRGNLDVPGGQVKTADGNVAVRTLGESDDAEVIADIVVRSDPTGRVIRVGDVADVVDGFEDADILGRFNGKPAVSVTVYKTADQDAIVISEMVRALVAGKQRLPIQTQGFEDGYKLSGPIEKIYEDAWADPYTDLFGQVEVQTHTNLARFIEGRLDLLRRNGTWGLTLVFLSLLALLNWRIAFWVMIGLLLAILGTLMAMKVAGLTLNLISMFGLIVVLGLLVDDAIIVAEHVYSHVEEGVSPRDAAIIGTEAVTKPVTIAIATTIVAFAPLLFIEGRIGAFMGVLPWIVMCALTISLFEALTILPSHLAEWLRPFEPATADKRAAAAGPLRRINLRLRAIQQHLLKDILIARYERFLRLAVSYRYVTMTASIACLIVAVGVVSSRHVPFVFLQKMDSETLIAQLKMPVGTPIERTDAAIRVVEEAAMNVPELSTLYTLVGGQVDMREGTASASSHLGQCIMELKPIEVRERNSEEILRELRATTGELPGVNSLQFEGMQGGPGGKAIEIEISGERVESLLAVSEYLKKRLREFAGVYDITDDFDAGRREAQIELLDSARALGLTTELLATQVRAAFYGLEARKVQRAREDVKIMVRYPESARRQVYDLESMWIATPSGTLVPFTEVARMTEGEGYATIRRKDQKRTVTLQADVDDTVAAAPEIVAQLQPDFAALQEQYPGITFDLAGRQRELRKSFGSLWKDFIVAILMIYVLLAGLFKSYVQPLIVMTAIPFGLVGAVAGHYVMGYPLTILSVIGLVALTGIVVNDSLILVDFINRRIKEGVDVFEAVIAGGRVRIRAILLTSITTILGLAPLLAETSFQARFLIPMGISIAFGLAFATILTLVVVPSLYMIVYDVRRGLAAMRGVVPPIGPGTRARITDS